MRTKAERRKQIGSRGLNLTGSTACETKQENKSTLSTGFKQNSESKTFEVSKKTMKNQKKNPKNKTPPPKKTQQLAREKDKEVPTLR